MRILTSKEENLLSTQEKIKYYEELREYLLSTKHENLSRGSLTVCPVINPIVRKALEAGCGYKIYTEGNDVKGLVGIYAFTHQDKFDHVNFVVTNPNHTILLNSAVLAPIYKMAINMNGVVYVQKGSREDRHRVKLELARLGYLGKSMAVFPESAWNLSPNKLHLPMYYGIVDIARKTGLPIIPVVQEYEYKNKMDGKEHIDYVSVRYGDPIDVKVSDDLDDKLEEVSAAYSTMRWEEIEKKGIVPRATLSNDDYINFIRASYRNLENAGIDMGVEEHYIFGADDPFYEDHYMNAVAFDHEGNFLEKGTQKTIKK